MSYVFIIFLKIITEKTYNTRAISAADSRRINADCVVFSFFDYHDLWHFTSAFGVFVVSLAVMLADEKIADTIASIGETHYPQDDEIIVLIA